MAHTGDRTRVIGLAIITTTATQTTPNEETLIDPKSVAPDIREALASTDQDRRAGVQGAGQGAVDMIEFMATARGAMIS